VNEIPIQLRIPLAGVGSLVLEPGITYATTEYDDIRRISEDPRFDVIVERPVVADVAPTEAPDAEPTVEPERKPKRGDK